MLMDDRVLPTAVSDAWDRRWPECPPIAHWLRDRYSDRWVRFHSLPESKRYADNAAEYATVLERHNVGLTELEPGAELVVITCEWTEHEDPPRERSSLLAGLDRDGVHWRTVQEDPDAEPEFQVFWHLFVSRRPWQPGALDDLMCAVADDQIANVIVGPDDLRWLYHPYDGGADVILPSSAERDVLKERHREWLSGHPLGL
jgi:hypothetical protein